MIWIITSPERIHEEASIIAALLSAGAGRILLRKPDWTTAQYAALLDQLPAAHYAQLLIRDQPALAAAYGLAGVHWSGEGMSQFISHHGLKNGLTTESPDAAEEQDLQQENKRRTSGQTKQPPRYTSLENFKENSTGIHTIDEIMLTDKRILTLLLSPVFDSISKPGYQGKSGKHNTVLPGWTANQPGQKHPDEAGYQKPPLRRQLLALGGVDHHNIHLVKQWQFHGAALLGAIWKTPAHAVENYYRIQELWNRTDLL